MHDDAPLSILVLSTLYPPHSLGGYEIRCQQVCDGLVQKGHAVTILCSQHGVDSPVTDTQDGVEVRRLLHLLSPLDQAYAVHNVSLERIRTAARNFSVTRRVIDDFRPDLVFAWSQLRLTAAPLRAALESHVPLAFSLGDENIMSCVARDFTTSPKRILACLLEKSILSKAVISRDCFKHVHCISQKLKANLLQKGLPIDSAVVIYRGIPLEKFPPKQEPGHTHAPLRLLYIGRLEAYKGVHTILDSLKLLQESGSPPMHLTIVGDGSSPYKSELLQKCKELSAEVVFAGQVNHERIPGICRESDILLFPSIWDEPFGATHLEAMASGTVVISTRGGGQDEFIVDGQNALVFEKNCPEQLAGKIRLLIEQPELMKALARNALHMVCQEFSYDWYVQQIESFLRDVHRASRREGAGASANS